MNQFFALIACALSFLHIATVNCFDGIPPFNDSPVSFTSMSTEASPIHGEARIITTGSPVICNGLSYALNNEGGNPDEAAYFSASALRHLFDFERAIRTPQGNQFVPNYSDTIDLAQEAREFANHRDAVILLICKQRNTNFPTLCMVGENNCSGYANTPYLENLFTRDMHFVLDFESIKTVTVGMVDNLSKMLRIIEQKGLEDRSQSVEIGTFNKHISKTFLSNLECWLTIYTESFNWICSTWLYCLVTQDVTARTTRESLLTLPTAKTSSWWSRLRLSKRKRRIVPEPTAESHPIWGSSPTTAMLDSSFSSATNTSDMSDVSEYASA
jgi:hypothetical protein